VTPRTTIDQRERLAPLGERGKLLLACLETPDDDTTRLVYADWLDEFGDCDRDRATSEFIRLTCTRFKVSRTMPRAAYPWIEANWQRLIPTCCEILTINGCAYRNTNPTGPRHTKTTFIRRGRSVSFCLTYTRERSPLNPAHRFFVAEFNRGFVDTLHGYSKYDKTDTARRLWVDQPGASFWTFGS